MGRTLAQMGLYTWDQVDDDYDYIQLVNNWNIVNFHDHTPGRGVQIPMGGLAPGSVGAAQLAPGVPLVTGGHSIQSVADTRASTAYGTMTNPDQVSGIILGSTGMIRVWYQAQWQESVAGQGRAAIFVGPNQLKVATPGTVPTLSEAATSASSTTAVYGTLATTNYGLGSSATQGIATTGADVTTGEAFGAASAPITLVNSASAPGTSWGSCSIFAAAGTYAISVQFRAISGSVTVNNRRLYVQVLPL